VNVMYQITEGRSMQYDDFLKQKEIVDAKSGFEPGAINPMLYDFQAAITKWALRRGRVQGWGV